jgi:hypothetical protein
MGDKEWMNYLQSLCDVIYGCPLNNFL